MVLGCAIIVDVDVGQKSALERFVRRVFENEIPVIDFMHILYA